MEYVVRPAAEADLDAIAAIYAREVEGSIATFEETVPPLARWQGRLAGATNGEHLLVAASTQVHGYAYSSVYRSRTGYRHTRETSVYLDAEARGRGMGRALYGELLGLLRADGVHTALAAVALPNPASEALHRALGFRHLGTMREVGFKFGGWIDVGWWQSML